jgi:predicted HicB family RNase H-like nuclease
MMKYKGYTGIYAFEEGSYRGRVAGLRDVITFDAYAEKDVETEFRKSIDDYLDMCAVLREAPESPR